MPPRRSYPSAVSQLEESVRYRNQALEAERRALFNEKRALKAEQTVLQLRKRLAALDGKTNVQPSLKTAKGERSSSRIAARPVTALQKAKAARASRVANATKSKKPAAKRIAKKDAAVEQEQQKPVATARTPSARATRAKAKVAVTRKAKTGGSRVTTSKGKKPLGTETQENHARVDTRSKTALLSSAVFKTLSYACRSEAIQGHRRRLVVEKTLKETSALVSYIALLIEQ
ncbi:hypothetical protein FRC05_010678 [Tulasnella sp. 425]|nr:hypothetical protein FRC05_010678 [Tulasnella sp. 425]